MKLLFIKGRFVNVCSLLLHEEDGVLHSLDIDFEPSDEGFHNDNIGLTTSTNPWKQAIDIYVFAKDHLRSILSEDLISNEDFEKEFELGESSLTSLEGILGIALQLLEVFLFFVY